MNWDSKEKVLKEVMAHPFMLEYASERLKDDKDVVLEAVKSIGYVLRFASDRLKNDKDVMAVL